MNVRDGWEGEKEKAGIEVLLIDGCVGWRLGVTSCFSGREETSSG